MNETMNRRKLLKLMGFGAGTALLAACGAPAAPAAPAATEAPAAPAATEAPKATEAPAAPAATEAPKATEAPAATEAPKEMMTSLGKKLPDDAAPPEQQVYVIAGTGKGGTFLDISANVYNRGALADLYGIPLTRINKDFESVPGSAKSWKIAEDGLSWTFLLRDDIKWSDDTPLTADDFVATFQNMANPKSAYDFTWYYSKGSGNIKNFDEVVGGKVPVTDLGVKKGANDYELIFETGEPTPYLPQLFGFAMPLQAKALAAHGPAYNTDPKTAVSCGPFIIKEYTPTRVEAVANPKVNPDFAPYLERAIAVEFANGFQAYQANQIDSTTPANTAELDTVLADAALSKEAYAGVGDFRVDYFFFDTRVAPFDNKKFRQALGHLLDRDSVVKFVTKPILARPAYSMLAPGFPAANGEALKKYSDYNIETAKALFAESGLDAAKLGTLTITNRDTDSIRMGICQAFADSIKQNLGITVEVKGVVGKDYMADLLGKDADGKRNTTISFGRIDYGMDYLDPSNMLSVMKGSDQGGRHTWNNKEFQDLLAKAGPLTNVEERTKLYQQAEELMVEESPFIFVVYRQTVLLYKPYIKGAPMGPGKINTLTGMDWPGFQTISTFPEQIYIGKEVADIRPTVP